MARAFGPTWQRWMLAAALALAAGSSSPARAGGKLDAQLLRLKQARVNARDLARASRGGALKLRVRGERIYVSVLARAEPAVAKRLRDLGARTVRLHGPILTAEVPLDALEAIEKLPGLLHMRAARKLHPHLDVSVPILPSNSIGIELGRSAVPIGGYLTYPPPWEPSSGAGVVVGVVDTGIDHQHQDFDDPSGNTRIRWLWDQDSGQICTAAQINAGTCTHSDTNGHGTHVASTAAGSGRATGNGRPAQRFVGLAPAADLIGVATTLYDSDILDGVAWVFEQATALGRPAVVNLSLGGHAGPHDGTDLFDLGLDALAGPGQIVVTSAGNEGSDYIHNQATWSGTDVAFQFKPGADTRNWILLTIWHNGLDAYQVRVSNGSTTHTWNPGTSSTQDFGTPQCQVWLANPAAGVTAPNGDREILIDWFCKSTATWTITFVGTSVSSADPNRIDGWIYLDRVVGSYFTNGDNASSVGTPGTSRTALTVGAYTSKASWPSINGWSYTYGYTAREICPFSSLGPTRDGRTKPDISGPGSSIAAAYSSASTTYTELVDPDGVHVNMQGTSMSSPHLTGLTALLLQRHPTYGPAAVKSILAYRANRDAWVGSTPSNTWGQGKAHADDALGTVDQNLPRLASADQQPTAKADNTLVARFTGFVAHDGQSPARALYQWQKWTGALFESIPGAIYPRLEPQHFTSGDLIRLVATPYEPSPAPADYSGLLLGASQVATQTIGAPAGFASHTGSQGWYMASIPTQSDSAILADFPGQDFYAWDETKQAYQVATAIERGRGYWVEVLPDQGDMHSDGAAAADQSFVSPLLTRTSPTDPKPGRHLLGNPYNQPIYWENVWVSTDPGDFNLRVTDPGASSLIHNVYYAAYDNTAGAYRYYDPADLDERDGKIFPWEGLWVIAKQDVYLKIDRTQPVPKAAWQQNPYPLPAQSTETLQPESTGFVARLQTALDGETGKKPPMRDWRLKLSAYSGNHRDDYNYLGLRADGRPGYDPLDIPDAGTLNSRNHVLLYAQHDDWDAQAGRYCIDIRSSRKPGTQRWDWILQTRGLSEPVTLFWNRPPAGWQLWLIDQTDGSRVDMVTEQRVTLSAVGDQTRRLSVLATPRRRPLDSRLR